jgi:hypothetical protein
MKTKTTKSRRFTKSFSIGAPEPEEWFFAKVPEDEIVTCFYYEYSRERDDIRQLVCFWRRNLADLGKAYDAAHAHEARMAREGVTQKFWRELAQLTDSTCSQLLINLPEFPSAPWQKIRPSRRAKSKHLLSFYDDLDRIRGGLHEERWGNVRNAIESGDLVTKSGEIVPFLIDWRGGVQKVIIDFENWARKHYASLDLRRKKKARDTYYEKLKQLGVTRLKERLGNWDDVMDYTHKTLGCKLYGDDHALWRKARLSALRRVRDMFPITRAY